MENCRYTFVPIWKRLKIVFRTIASVNQLSLYEAIAEMCEEYENFHDRRGDTRCGRAVEFLIRAKCDQERRSFG